jgi:dihydrofolate reductase
MRRVIVSMMISVDGFFAGPHDEIDWHHVDEEFNDYASELLDSVDTLIFGRATYEGMASYWPTEAATANDPIIAGKMNSVAKVVFSHTLESTPWGAWDNATLAKAALGEEIDRLKQEPGKDLAIFGSGSIVTALATLGLIDEYRLLVNPVALGSGKSLFSGVSPRLDLTLVSARTFRSGNVLLTYHPGKG